MFQTEILERIHQSSTKYLSKIFKNENFLKKLKNSKIFEKIEKFQNFEKIRNFRITKFLQSQQFE